MRRNPSQLRRSIARFMSAMAVLPLLSGCNMIVLNPAGDVAQQQGDMVVTSTFLLLLIIAPVMALTALFAWHYRASNKTATYKPDWSHSTQLELVIWAAPLLIIICLGAITWVGTHMLDPYRAISRTAPGQPVDAAVKPLEVEVVALDWKWLFIYPEQGIATVNELAAPVGRPIHFRISASSVMNSFYVPALAGQVYAMPAMETQLHGVFNKPGNFVGFSANYSGAGFSNMRFRSLSLTPEQFDVWVKKVKAGGDTLDRARYLQLEKPSEKVPVMRFANVEQALFDRVVNLCVEPGKMCMHEMMAIDAKGGLGTAGIYNVRPLTYDKDGARGSSAMPRDYVAELCASPLVQSVSKPERPVNMAPLVGAGLSRPGQSGADQSRPAPLRSVASADAPLARPRS